MDAKYTSMHKSRFCYPNPAGSVKCNPLYLIKKALINYIEVPSRESLEL